MSDPHSRRLQPIRTGNVFEETMEHVLALLRLGQFPPASKLPAERELAATLGVSRTTLRDVLAELRSAGFVTVRRGRYGGTYVGEILPTTTPTTRPSLPRGEVEDVLTLRAVVEPAAAALAAARTLSGAEREALLATCAEAAAASLEQYRPLDSRLHLLIADLSGSPGLARVVADVRTRLNALLDRIPQLTTNLQHSSDQHEAIVSAVLDGDAATAERVSAEHLNGTAALLRGFLSGDGEREPGG